MLAKKYKLPIPEFLSKRPKIVFRSDFFTVKKNFNDLGFSRFGVLISKKVSNRAVQRNRIKRAVFNAAKNKKSRLISGYDYLINVFPEAAKLEREDLKKNIEKMFSD